MQSHPALDRLANSQKSPSNSLRLAACFWPCPAFPEERFFHIKLVEILPLGPTIGPQGKLPPHVGSQILDPFGGSSGPYKDGSSTFTSWWLNQPIWKICSSKWIISPGRGENKKYLKPPPSLDDQIHIRKSNQHRRQINSMLKVWTHKVTVLERSLYIPEIQVSPHIHKSAQ